METLTRHLDDVIAFHHVATQGSFTAAAERLGTAKSSLSKQIRRLEASLGTLLMERSTRKLKLTAEGATLLAHSARIVASSREVESLIRDMKDGSTGVLRISTPVSLGETLLPDFSRRLHEVLPKVTIESDLSNENRDFNRDEIDFAIRASETAQPDLVSKRLGRLRDAIVCSPDYLRRHKSLPIRSPLDLRQHACIANSLDRQWNHWSFRRNGAEVVVEISGKLSTNQYTLVRDYARSGSGIARVPYYYVRKDIAEGRLVPLLTDHTIATHSIYLLYAKRSYPTRRHQVARALILKWFQDHPDIFAS